MALTMYKSYAGYEMSREIPIFCCVLANMKHQLVIAVMIEHVK